MRTSTICLTLALILAGPVGDVCTAETADLEVTRVAIFSSGVAYFECQATVDGNATAELNFRTDQINDIIKSLVVQDLDGGSVGTVSYASHDPIEKTLRSFGVDITGNPTLPMLLDQLRGEPVEITGARSLKGVIFGVEKLSERVGNDGVIDVFVLNVLTQDGLQQLRLADLQGIKLTNEKIDAELRKALETLATGHDADKKSVVLNFNGQGERRVSVAYLLEAPIWKTTYRLVLDEEGQPFLQGWATVENATEEDWRDVRLSLVSGRPISFTMDLYTPIYIPRPQEELELYASLRPPEYAGAFEMELEDRTARGAGGRGRVARAKGVPEAPAAMGAGRRFAGDAAVERLGEPAEWAGQPIELGDAGVASVATAAEAGELFQYTIRTPVSIPRQHSAMLPIVNQKVSGEKVSIFNPATHPKYALNGLELKNTTELHLMQGPITLFDGNVYAGDAKLPDLKPDEQRLVAYALDLGTEVMVKGRSHPDEIVSLRIVRGTLIHKHKYTDEREYVVKNKTDKQRTVLLEQPYGDEWKLLEPSEPHERAPGLSRFKVAVPAAETKQQTVKLEQVTDQSLALTNIDSDRIRFYIRSRVISAAVKKALERVIELQDELARVRQQREQAERDLNEQVAEQA
ncbi:MAG: DUF4139 domain-containing protein, partial [Planctomycetes bacterium]|nr:DUF4139 domain-containing protein [Planctomycetota bacterium]